MASTRGGGKRDAATRAQGHAPARAGKPAPHAKPERAAGAKAEHQAKPKGNAKPERGAKPEKAAKPARAVEPRPADGWIAVAEVARPHGIQGELRLKVYNPDSDLLVRKPRVRLRMPDGSLRDTAIVSARDANKALLVRLSGVDDRDAAEALRGAEICVAREAFPPLEEGEFYACDIEGARAVLPSGEEVGHVAGLQSYPTCDVLLLERKAGGRLEVPLLAPYVGKVDAAAGVVEILTLDGLE
jgi:16S rRNA processing protein RimM